MTENIESTTFNHNMIYNWERSVNPLAPLSSFQRNFVLDLSQEIKELGPFFWGKKGKEEEKKAEPASLEAEITTTKEFLYWYFKKEDDWMDQEDVKFKKYMENLEKRKSECCQLLEQVDTGLKHLTELNQEYQEVSFKTNSLHQVSESLTNDQLKLVGVKDALVERLEHFRALERVSRSIESGSLTVHSANIASTLDQIISHIDYLNQHEYKEAWWYRSRWSECLKRVVGGARAAVVAGLCQASAQAASAASNPTSHYAKFLSAAHSVKPLISLLETRIHANPVLETAVGECEQCYVEQRSALMGGSVASHMQDLVARGTAAGDLCALMRSACAFLLHVSLDEYHLYHQFFTNDSPIFTKYLESLCQSLYDTTRPIVIHMKHLETLAELCSILRLEMLHEHCSNNKEALGAMGGVVEQLLEDVQERLVFRAHRYVQTDIAQYNPSPGDLAYPEKLHMIQSIAESLQEGESRSLVRSGSVMSLGSTVSQDPSHLAPSSPGELHCMWYPAVRRTVVCLSRMYRCVDRPVFQGISQEALTACISALTHASALISSNKTPIDGELFLIKHLLILREQIAPFQVDFTVKEMTLDFSKMKIAAGELVSKRSRLFSLSSENALLEFLVEGTPRVREHCLDSRKEVDSTLKAACHSFIQLAAHHLLGPALVTAVHNGERRAEEGVAARGGGAGLDPQELSVAVTESIRAVKARLAPLQTTLHLYLSNRGTEFILYRPVKNMVIGYYSRLQHVMSESGLSEDVTRMVGCPSPEQAAILLSSASLEALDHHLPSSSAAPPPSHSVKTLPSPRSPSIEQHVTTDPPAGPSLQSPGNGASDPTEGEDSHPGTELSSPPPDSHETQADSVLSCRTDLTQQVSADLLSRPPEPDNTHHSTSLQTQQVPPPVEQQQHSA